MASVRGYLWQRWLRLFPDLCLRNFGFTNLSSEAEGQFWSATIEVLVRSEVLERKVATAFAQELRNVHRDNKPSFDFDAVLRKSGASVGGPWEFREALHFLLSLIHRHASLTDKSELAWRLERVVSEAEATLPRETDPRRRLARELILSHYHRHLDRLRATLDRRLFRILLLRFTVFYLIPALALLAAAPLWLGRLWALLSGTLWDYGAQILAVYATMIRHLVYGFETPKSNSEYRDFRQAAYEEYERRQAELREM